jgi:zinc and cadmium transporter
MSDPVLLTLLSVIGVSLVSLVGIALAGLKTSLLQKGMLYFVGFSTGAILGDVFLHMLPELAEGGDLAAAMPIVLGGMLFSFIIEKAIHWHHCHVLPGKGEGHSHHHHHPVGYLCLVGDGIHNVVDGVLIAGSYLVSVEVGIATTVAVLLHEIPQELGDYALLVYSGFSKKSAMLWNLASALTAVLGAMAVLFIHAEIASIGQYLLPFAAGNLLYIAGSDLIPELHKHTGARQGLLQFIMMLAGMLTMYAMLFLE